MTEVRQQRRLATILAADVFGYSRLTAENEEDALRTLKAHRVVIDRLIARHDGRIFNIAGDSVLAEFGSAVEAVRCAITIQEELRVRNAQIDENRRMDFRIGINVGDVLVDGDNLYGDGVNIAARLESIAAPGSICISGSVFALVKNKLSYGFEDIGPQSMKNIPEPVSAFRLAPSSITKQAPGATRSVRGWALPVAAVAVVGMAGAGFFYWSERGKERIAAPVATPPVASASSTPGQPAPAAPPARKSEPLAPAFTTEILKTEPAIGQLPTGASVLIDDGTCPTGQLKQIIGGSVTTGQPRLRSCVPRPADMPPSAAPSAAPALPASAPLQLDSAALERMRPYIGNAVEGISNVTGKPFVMTLKAGGIAEVKIELATAGFTVDRGTWWIEPNGHFCVRYVHFAGGNIVCRELSVEGGGIKAYTRDHRPNPWVFKK